MRTIEAEIAVAMNMALRYQPHNSDHVDITVEYFLGLT